MNIKLQFSINIIKKVKSYHFQVDQIGSILFILFALYENKLELLDEFDDNNKQRRAFLLYKELESRFLIEETEREEVPHYTLTKEGRALVEFIQSEFKDEQEPHSLNAEMLAVGDVEGLKEGVVTSSDPLSPQNWIDEWIDIFPRGVKTLGKLIRSDRTGCLRKMEVFIKEYNYDKDTILGATRSYINGKRQEGWAFTRCSVYFIYRMDKEGKTSDLAAECEQFLYKKSSSSGDDTQTSENNLEIMA